MDSTDFLGRVKDLAREAAHREGCMLYDLEFVGKGKGRILRVFIDKQDGGVDIDDCAKVSHSINELLDAEEDLIPGGAYNLEVSSPGLERVLKEPWQYQLVLNQKLWIKLDKPLGELGVEARKFKTSKVFTAHLISCNEDGVQLSVEGEEVEVPFSIIEKAKTVFEFGNEAGSGKR